MKAGDIIYLFNRKPVYVEINKFNTCFIELLVKYENKIYLMVLKTHILLRFGTEMDCNEILPSDFILISEWFRIAPIIREIKNPIILKTIHIKDLDIQKPRKSYAAGIYTHESKNIN